MSQAVALMGGSSWVGERDSTLVLVAAELSHEVTILRMCLSSHVSASHEVTDCPLLRMCEPL